MPLPAAYRHVARAGAAVWRPDVDALAWSTAPHPALLASAGYEAEKMRFGARWSGEDCVKTAVLPVHGTEEALEEVEGCDATATLEASDIDVLLTA